MLLAWRDFIKSLVHHARTGRPPTPQLTSLENPDRYIPPSPCKRPPFVSAFSADTPSSVSSQEQRDQTAELDNIAPVGVHHRASYERITSETRFLAGPPKDQIISIFEASSEEPSRNSTPPPHNPYIPYSPTREAPTPPPHSFSRSSKNSVKASKRTSSNPRASSTLSIQRTNSSKLRPRISGPVPGTFVHVSGAGPKLVKGSPGMDVAAPVDEGRRRDGDSWDEEKRSG